MYSSTSSTTGSDKVITIHQEINQLSFNLDEEGFPSTERAKLHVFFTKNSNNIEFLDLVSNVLNTIPNDNYNERLMYLKELLPAMELQTTIMNLDTDIIDDNDLMECFIELDLFSWWFRPNSNTLKLYVNGYSQWMELKNLMIGKYPNAKQINRDAFFLEKEVDEMKFDNV
ncbi:hypothetical protein RhiirA5_423197 [Rhizophagus irregularis]|uniref:Uncharacterized protein n=1 Tax=Rhizophagus irregularis TaxID=588596 RepID=A0A2N0P4E2_9GLOM|nr:hypothetical protein RhiirA5_426314 [Rhizophagus irregularis]PKC03817.1 hypothetical protein RhiirA5_423197 [Rhizophagus irregularis]CAB5145228.1 unnamed protein product [Rhizophagus irregularis]